MSFCECWLRAGMQRAPMWAPQGQNLGVGASRLGRSQKLMATGHDRQHRQQNPVEDQVGDFMGLDMETDGTQRHDHQPQGRPTVSAGGGSHSPGEGSRPGG